MDDEYDDDDEGGNEFDPSGTDPVVRELRLEIVRLQAQIDQIDAANRERVAEMDALGQQIAELRADIADTRRRIDRLKRKMLWLGLTAGLVGSLLGNAIVALL